MPRAVVRPQGDPFGKPRPTSIAENLRDFIHDIGRNQNPHPAESFEGRLWQREDDWKHERMIHRLNRDLGKEASKEARDARLRTLPRHMVAPAELKRWGRAQREALGVAREEVAFERRTRGMTVGEKLDVRVADLAGELDELDESLDPPDWKALRREEKTEARLAKLRVKWRSALVKEMGEPAPPPPPSAPAKRLSAPTPVAPDGDRETALSAAEDAQAPRPKKRRIAGFSTTSYLD